MKNLNILKPAVKTGYLESGKGQEVTYLNVPHNITYKQLEEDVKNGAKSYGEMMELLKKKPSRFVIVNCSNEEEGLTAVSYLSAIYNRMEGFTPEDDDCLEDDISDEIDITFEDFEDEDAINIYDDEDEEDDDWEDDACWQETPWKIPIIKTTDFMADNNIGFSPFGNGGINYGRMTNPRNRLPYWYYTRKESICIVHNMYNSFLVNSLCDCRLNQKLNRYTNNRHVFIVVVTDKKTAALDSSCEYSNPDKSALCEIILEHSAATFIVSCKDEELSKHHANLFENWISDYDHSLAKGFPVNKIVHNIVGMNNPAKSALMEKVIKYVLKDNDKARELTETDFDVLNQFKALGANLSKSEHASTKKMQDNIVGMDSVKEQINGIVEVMRYNKRRANMGLDTGNFHNVHMMLGAPGTAKTTIAELLGNIMAEERLLSGNRFITINGAELKGMYVGHSAPKVKALFDEYDIIFIDEAYAVASGMDGEIDSFGQEAISQLIIELEKHGMDRLVMFAGYGGSNVSEKDNKMKKFLQSNPGIRSRINSTIYFDSYNADEMLEIFKCHAKISQFTVNKKAHPLVRDFFAERINKDDFGNGREARSLLENSMIEAAKRLASVPESDITVKMMREITVEDIKNAINRMRVGTNMQIGRVSKVGFSY